MKKYILYGVLAIMLLSAIAVTATIMNSNPIPYNDDRYSEEDPYTATSTPGNTTEDEPDQAPETPTTPPTTKCYVGGCSGQLCSSEPGMVSTCEWRAEYACYQRATCEVQPSGACGWTPTTELNACLANPPDSY